LVYEKVSKMATKIKGLWVKVLEPGLIQVQSFTNPEKWYVVDRRENTCTCPDFRFRGRKCKHIQFVEEHETDIRWEEKIWKAMKEFEEWRRNLILEKIKRFKPVDEETKKVFKALGFEYDESLSATLSILFME